MTLFIFFKNGKSKLVSIFNFILILVVSGLMLCGQGVAATNIDDNITEDTTWELKNSPYVISPGASNAHRVTILSGAMLTIEPGVVIQFDSPQGFLKVEGVLKAQGTVDNNIRFTRAPDFTDHWNGIIFDGTESSSSILTYAHIEYGGSRSTSGNGEGMITYWNGASPQIVNCRLTDSKEIGMYIDESTPIITDNIIQNSADYGIVLKDCSPSITRNTFTDNDEAILLETETGSAFPTFDGNTFGPNDGIMIKGNVLNSGTWGYAGAPYVISPGASNAHRVTILSGAMLTIEPGVVIQFDSPQGFLKVEGVLKAQGTVDNNIRFTRAPDFTDHWNGIIFDGGEASGSILKYAVLDHGGYTSVGGNGNGMITCWNSASPQISDCRITGSYDIGIYTTDGSNPLIIRNQIYGNSNYGVFNKDSSTCIDARYNFWGAPTGPLDDSNADDCVKNQGFHHYNPQAAGNPVSNHVIYNPWNRSAMPCDCPDTDGDGVPDAWDDCPGSTVKSKYGCKEIWDINSDQKTGLPEAIHILHEVSGMESK